jgi:hypothetical protein
MLFVVLARLSLLAAALSLNSAACEQRRTQPKAEEQSSVGDSASQSLDPQRQQEAWREVAPMNEPRLAHTVATLRGLIYAIGGLGGRGESVEVFDPRTKQWAFKASLPIPIDHGWAAATNARVFVGDGRSRRVFAYDPNQDKWSEVARPRFNHGESPAVGAIGTQIYVAGGSGEGMRGTEVEVYDSQENVWSTLPSMECSRHHTVGGVVNGVFHVVGGRPDVQRCHEAYDPVKRKWTRKADLPTGREGATGAVVGGLLYVFGGEGNPADPDFVFNNVEVYDARSDSWKALTPMPVGKHGIGAAAIGDTIYVPGGGQKTRVMRRVDAYVVQKTSLDVYLQGGRRPWYCRSHVHAGISRSPLALCEAPARTAAVSVDEPIPCCAAGCTRSLMRYS